MYKRILIATDGSALAKKAEGTGLELTKTLKAEAIAVTVTEPVEALSMGRHCRWRGERAGAIMRRPTI